MYIYTRHFIEEISTFTMDHDTDSPTSSTAPTKILRTRTVNSRLRSDSLRTEPYPNLREKSAAAKSKGKKKKTVPDRVAGGGELSGSSNLTTGSVPTSTDSATNCTPRQSSKTSTAISCPRCKDMGHVATTCSFATHLPDALTCHQCVRTYTNGGSALDVHRRSAYHPTGARPSPYLPPIGARPSPYLPPIPTFL